MLQNYNLYRVLSVFLENPTKGFGWKELSKKIRLGPPSVKRYLDELKKESMIVEKVIAGRKLYFANRESRKYRLFLTFDIVMKLEDSGFIDFINRSYGYPAVILFGSHKTGEAIENSDIDIAIISESKKEVNVETFEKYMKKEIQIFTFRKSEFKKLKEGNPSLYEGIINGYVISGHLEVS